jgi:hypothetical protein
MAAAMAFNPLNVGYSPLNAVIATLPLNVLAGDLKHFEHNKTSFQIMRV